MHARQASEPHHKMMTYMTPNLVPTLRHLLLFCHTPGLPRPFSLGLGAPPPRPGLVLSFSLGPGLQRPTFEVLKLGLLRPLPQWDGLVHPGLNQPEPSFACGELRFTVKLSCLHICLLTVGSSCMILILLTFF